MHLKEMHKILSGESKCMLGIYLSGTGNTKYCVTKLVKLIDASADVVPLEDEFIIDKIKRNETVILGISDAVFECTIHGKRFYQNECLFVEGQENDMCCDNGSI